jgi:hypothetical protein
MSPITTLYSWSHSDQLDGIDLIDGEALMLRWPDGHTERVTIRVEKMERAYMDHGHQDSAIDSIAYVEVVIHGAEIGVNVGDAGFQAERAE